MLFPHLVPTRLSIQMAYMKAVILATLSLVTVGLALPAPAVPTADGKSSSTLVWSQFEVSLDSLWPEAWWRQRPVQLLIVCPAHVSAR
jgi:hypothetical protein